MQVNGVVTDVSRLNHASYWVIELLVSGVKKRYALGRVDPKDRDIKVGQQLTLFFDRIESAYQYPYYAYRLINRSLEGGVTSTELPTGEQMKEDLKKVIEETEQWLDVPLDKKELSEFKDLVLEMKDVAVRVIELTLKYEDCKKDQQFDIGKNVLDLAVSMALYVDTNTNQIIKKAVERAEKSEKSEKADAKP